MSVSLNFFWDWITFSSLPDGLRQFLFLCGDHNPFSAAGRRRLPARRPSSPTPRHNGFSLSVLLINCSTSLLQYLLQSCSRGVFGFYHRTKLGTALTYCTRSKTTSCEPLQIFRLKDREKKLGQGWLHGAGVQIKGKNTRPSPQGAFAPARRGQDGARRRLRSRKCRAAE
jgi:hypothetical protein